ncbi:pheromone receptor transcription factor [Lichtheimia ornata]|uniref:Pheromone receptor transcription factor n=1 Tax=Lichtheimia ornata TaxID=688661 RepID=A0AAD7Y0W7_9FUNG|nr:pheromone receptor transcription factor [Lichtheimia ornata]KAJ8662000.1 pheromone receptor transcription factor [Lichtheimia ornata]
MQQMPSSTPITDTKQEATTNCLYPSQAAAAQPSSSLASIQGGVNTPTPQGFRSPLQPDDDSEEDDAASKPDIPNHKRNGRRKIKIEYIEDRSRRHITFSKRKAGIMKKAYELSTLTGTQVLLLVVSETGLVYTFTTPKLQPLVTKPEGKGLIQACLNAPDEPVAPNVSSSSMGNKSINDGVRDSSSSSRNI